MAAICSTVRNHLNKLTEGPLEPLVKSGQVVSEKKTFKDYTILYMYIAQGQKQITSRGYNFNCIYTFYYFNHTL